MYSIISKLAVQVLVVRLGDHESAGAAFCHPSFHREHPEKFKFIVRRTKKAAAASRKAAPAALSELPSGNNELARIGALNNTNPSRNVPQNTHAFTHHDDDDDDIISLLLDARKQSMSSGFLDLY